LGWKPKESVLMAKSHRHLASEIIINGNRHAKLACMQRADGMPLRA